MSRWRREAAERFPDLWRDEDARDSIYSFLRELGPFTRQAHHQDSTADLQRAYAFARWCLDQPGFEPANAVCVAFYEHLFDQWAIHDDVIRWLDPKAVQWSWPLWEHRLDEDKLSVLRQQLKPETPRSPRSQPRN